MSEENHSQVPILRRYPPYRHVHDSSRLSAKETSVDLFKKLHEFWVSDRNPQQGSCDKSFVGKGSHTHAHEAAEFVPTSVMMVKKVRLTAESAKVRQTLC